ncbi:hypothetical protein JTE90_017596 [Oedothorax gibbosus]|uniref:Uncharacterized protein n=1 Tax=Oedothorax gibbosus TaxID=931172 RepID=A0AAV6TNU0_9ARAC|nr:hypothetical protein JTE90_017596 [Oedothorax gibbosus]
MWFRVQLDSDLSPLAGLVGQDGSTLYWRVWDLGSLLRKRNPYAFVHSVSGGRVFRGHDIASPPLSPKTGRTLVVETNVVLTILQVYDVTLADQLRSALCQGKATLYQRGFLRFLANPFHSPLLLVHPEGETSVSEWIDTFCKEWTAFHQVELALEDSASRANTSGNDSEEQERRVSLIHDSEDGNCGESNPSACRRSSKRQAPTVYRAKPVTVNTFKVGNDSGKNSNHAVFGKVSSNDWFMDVEDDALPNKIFITHGNDCTMYVKELRVNQ